MLDADAAFDLLAAVLRLWSDDARRDPDELNALAAFVGMEPCQMTEALKRPAHPKPRRKPGRPPAL